MPTDSGSAPTSSAPCLTRLSATPERCITNESAPPKNVTIIAWWSMTAPSETTPSRTSSQVASWLSSAAPLAIAMPMSGSASSAGSARVIIAAAPAAKRISTTRASAMRQNLGPVPLEATGPLLCVCRRPRQNCRGPASARGAGGAAV